MEWPDKQVYADIVYEEIYRLNLFGRAEVWMDDKGQVALEDATWISLPFEEAIEIFKARVPILSKAAHRVLSDALKQKAWTIAGDNDEYSREQAKASLDTALEQGWSKGKWVKYARENGIPGLGKAHLETVFDTNILGAYQHGRWKQQNTADMVKRRPLLRYDTVGDSRVRATHEAMNGFTAPRDHPFWATNYPTNGFL